MFNSELILNSFSKFAFLEMYSFFWFVYIVGFVWLLAKLVDEAYYTSSFFTLLFGVLALDFLGNTPILYFILQYKYFLFLLVPIYLIAGSVWGLLKWRLYISDCFNKFIASKEEYCEKNGINEISNSELLSKNYDNAYYDKEIPSYINRIAGTVSRGKTEYTYVVRPYAYKHKSLILSWMIYWPFSLVSTLLYDSVAATFNYMKVKFISIRNSLMQRMEIVSINKFKSIQDEIDNAKQESKKFE